MHTLTVAATGQITVPIELQQELGIRPGIQLIAEIQNGNLVLMPILNDIEAAFGLLKAKTTVSLRRNGLSY